MLVYLDVTSSRPPLTTLEQCIDVKYNSPSKCDSDIESATEKNIVMKRCNTQPLSRLDSMALIKQVPDRIIDPPSQAPYRRFSRVPRAPLP